MPQVTLPQYFQLDTRDSSFQAYTMYAVWDAGTAVVYTRNDDESADVRFVLDVPLVESLRAAIQSGAIDVVGYQPLAQRPYVGDIKLNGITDDPQRIERIYAILKG